jgi:glycosyltransferase involved in cell wall biosynthesis
VRILIANWHRGIKGGAEKYLQTLFPALMQRGHEVGFLFENDETSGPTIDPNGDVPRWCLANLELPELLESVAEWNPSVVYTHGLVSAALEHSLLERHAVVCFAHGFYGTCGTGTKAYAFPVLRPCSRRFGPMCLALHYPRRCGGLNPLAALHTFQLQAQRNRFLARYRAVLVASQHMFGEYAEHEVPSNRLHFVPYPPTDFAPSLEPPVHRPPSQRILFVGRLTKLKGTHYLIKALPEASRDLGRPLTLCIAGTGPERQHLEDLARRHGVSAEFTGWANADQRWELINHSDLLAVPSLWPEPFALVGPEAGASGLPAVGYTVGGIPEWLIPGLSGELAPADPPTVHGLAAAITRALCNPDHYAQLRHGAWEVARRFSMNAHLNKLEAILADAA